MLMPPMLTLAMLAPAGLAACCVAADPHRRAPRVWLSAVVMLAAMLDSAVLGLVPSPLWALAVGVGAVASTVAARRSGAVEGMQLHRAVSGLVMAALLFGAGSASTAHAHGLGLRPTLIAAAVALLAGGAVLAARTLRERGWRGTLLAAEPVLMSLSVAVMALAH